MSGASGAKPVGQAPALSSDELSLWAVSKADRKIDFNGLLTQGESRTKVIATIETNTKTGRPFLSIAKVDGDGADAKFAPIGTANAVNSVNGTTVAAGRVRRLIADIDLGDGQDRAFSVFIRPGLTEEVFRKLGFEGPMTFYVKPESKAPAPMASA